MNHIQSRLLRLSLPLALLLAATTQPVARARELPDILPCLSITGQGTISGTVRDSDGKPLANVAVRAYTTAGDSSRYAATNAAGQYEFANTPIGSYLLEFTPARGPSQTAWYANAASPLDATPVVVNAGATTSGVDAKLPAGAQFSVTLRDPEGDPVPQAELYVIDRHGRMVAGGMADDQGRALTSPGLPVGAYRLFARPPAASALLAEYYNHKPALDDADELTLTKASGTVDVNMSLQRGARLSGTVTDATSGSPLANIYVSLQGDDVELYAMTDAQGKYTLAGVPSGIFGLSFDPGKPAPDDPMPLRRLVSVSAPNEQTGVDAKLTRGGAISGRVTAANGNPLADVRVLASDGRGIQAERFTAADGSYTIYGLPSGRYTVSFDHSQYLREYHNDQQQPAAAEPVTVSAPHTTAQVNAVLAPGGSISGKVTDSDGKPVANVDVSIVSADTGKPYDAFLTTDAAGVYKTAPALPDGSYRVKFQPRSGGPCPLSVEYFAGSTTAAGATRVHIGSAQPVSGIDAALDYGGLISGQLTDAASGLPVGGTAYFYNASGELVLTAYVGYLGRYRTPAGLPAGAYRVKFVAGGYVPVFYGGAATLEDAATVPSGSADINAALTRGGTIRGRITAADTGTPLEYASVTLYDDNDRVVEQQLTGFDGSYSFSGNLPTDEYRIGVTPGLREDGTPYFSGYRAVFSGGAGSLAEAKPVAVVAPRAVNADLAMPPLQTPPPSTARSRIHVPLVWR